MSGVESNEPRAREGWRLHSDTPKYANRVVQLVSLTCAFLLQQESATRATSHLS